MIFDNLGMPPRQPGDTGNNQVVFLIFALIIKVESWLKPPTMEVPMNAKEKAKLKAAVCPKCHCRKFVHIATDCEDDQWFVREIFSLNKTWYRNYVFEDENWTLHCYNCGHEVSSDMYNLCH